MNLNLLLTRALSKTEDTYFPMREHTCCDRKDGELCLGRGGPQETQEVRSGSGPDVQIVVV